MSIRELRSWSVVSATKFHLKSQWPRLRLSDHMCTIIFMPSYSMILEKGVLHLLFISYMKEKRLFLSIPHHHYSYNFESPIETINLIILTVLIMRLLLFLKYIVLSWVTSAQLSNKFHKYNFNLQYNIDSLRIELLSLFTTMIVWSGTFEGILRIVSE